MTRGEWLAEFARRLDVQPPSDEEVEQLLSLAAAAAHASERTAAPIACWIAGSTPRALPELLELAREIG
jgi:Domain of unknown function (DUF6457)